MGYGHDKPSALQFKYRLRWYVMGKHYADTVSDNHNTEEDEDVSLIDSTDFQVHTNSAEYAMRQIMTSLYDKEM